MATTPPDEITLDYARTLERGGTRLHFVPNITTAVPAGTPPEQTINAVRATLVRRWMVVEADGADRETDRELGFLRADVSLLETADREVLETCDAIVAGYRLRCEAALALLLDPAASARRALLMGGHEEERSLSAGLGMLRQVEQGIEAIRHVWEGSFYHHFVRDVPHTQEDRTRMRAAIRREYDTAVEPFLQSIERYAELGRRDETRA